MAKIKNRDFFKSQSQNAETAHTAAGNPDPQDTTEPAADAGPQDTPHIHAPLKVARELLDLVTLSSKALHEAGLDAETRGVADLCSRLSKERFTVAVVGEFSTGKSSLINRLLERDIMPTADLPTTAMACKITFGQSEGMTVFARNGQVADRLPLSPESWKGLTADNFTDREPEGGVLVTLPDRWLARNGLEIIDTPGAGDLDPRRLKATERAIINSDATVVTISALKALSLTEQAFIRQKIAATRVPFVAIALTRLDQIPEEERAQAVDFVFKKLETLKLRLPVVVPSDVPMGEPQNKPIRGIDGLRRLIEAWAADPERAALTAEWLRANTASIVAQGIGLLGERRSLLDAKDVEREKLIAAKTAALAKVASRWDSLRDEMQTRALKCCDAFRTKADEIGGVILETLQHEADRQTDVRRWLEKEYGYRVKRELNAACITLNNYVGTIIANDMRWLNAQLNSQFKTMVSTTTESIAFKDDFTPDVNEKTLNLEDLGKKQVRATIVSMAASIGTALALAGAGPGLAILGTMGVGGGGNLLVRQIFSKKAAEQRQEVIRLIDADIPRIIAVSTEDSMVKIKLAYHNIITESHATERRWMQSQRELIKKANAAPADDSELKRLDVAIDSLKTISDKLNAGLR